MAKSGSVKNVRTELWRAALEPVDGVHLAELLVALEEARGRAHVGAIADRCGLNPGATARLVSVARQSLEGTGVSFTYDRDAGFVSVDIDALRTSLSVPQESPGPPAGDPEQGTSSEPRAGFSLTLTLGGNGVRGSDSVDDSLDDLESPTRLDGFEPFEFRVEGLGVWQVHAFERADWWCDRETLDGAFVVEIRCRYRNLKDAPEYPYDLRLVDHRGLLHGDMPFTESQEPLRRSPCPSRPSKKINPRRWSPWWAAVYDFDARPEHVRVLPLGSDLSQASPPVIPLPAPSAITVDAVESVLWGEVLWTPEYHKELELDGEPVLQLWLELQNGGAERLRVPAPTLRAHDGRLHRALDTDSMPLDTELLGEMRKRFPLAGDPTERARPSVTSGVGDWVEPGQGALIPLVFDLGPGVDLASELKRLTVAIPDHSDARSVAFMVAARRVLPFKDVTEDQVDVLVSVLVARMTDHSSLSVDFHDHVKEFVEEYLGELKVDAPEADENFEKLLEYSSRFAWRV